MQCCDCKLIHRMDFRLVPHGRGFKIQMRAFRATKRRKRRESDRSEALEPALTKFRAAVEAEALKCDQHDSTLTFCLECAARLRAEAHVFESRFADTLAEFGTIERLVDAYREAKMEARKYEAAHVDAVAHDWDDSKSTWPWPVCRVCGIVQRADGKNNPCKGPTQIELRYDPSERIQTDVGTLAQIRKECRAEGRREGLAAAAAINRVQGGQQPCAEIMAATEAIEALRDAPEEPER